MPSTVVARIEYDNESQILKITFLSGAVYAYYNVPDEVYVDLKKARSKGQFLNQHIKDVYDFEKLN